MSGVMQAQIVDIDQFQNLLKLVSPKISICVRGRHAAGKSESVYQAAASMRNDLYKDPKICAAVVQALGGTILTPNGKVTEWKYEYGVPVVERRLSQMTEGDIIGLPFREGKDKFDETGQRVSFSSTAFKPCDWLIASATFPVVLFMDERNRALPGVKQAVFQLTDSKAFYSTHLHPETRIVIAENVGDEYQVEACDPAEISRCATVDLRPSKQNFLDYIKPRVHPLMHEFLRQHQDLIEHEGAFEPNKKYADRRMWFKLDTELQNTKLYDDPSNGMLHVLVGSFVGTEPTSKFTNFLKEHNRQVSAEEILKDWRKAKKRLQLGGQADISNESYMECSHKLVDKISKKKMTEDQVYELARFMFDAPGEVTMTIWPNLQKNMDNMMAVHYYVKDLIVARTGTKTASGKTPTLKPKRTAKADSKTDTSASSDTSKKRGGRKTKE